MIGYKFLDAGRIGRFSRFQWPRPGVWVQAADGIAACRCGIHACRTRDLPWWLGRELWEVELGGDVAIDEHKLVAPAGRLRERIDAWTPECADEYGVACAWRARDRAARALRRAEHKRDAARLEACVTLEEVRALSSELASRVPDARISLAIARDGGRRALTSAPATSAYIAAHAARRLDGDAAYAAERRWQSEWLLGRLSLPTGY